MSQPRLDIDIAAVRSPAKGVAVQTPSNITARIGRWSVQHRKKAIFGWLAFVLIAMAVGFNVLPQKQIDPKAAGPGESGEAAKVIDGAFEDKSSEQVLIQSSELTAGDAQFKAAVADVTERLEGTNGVDDVVGPYQAAGRSRPTGLRARDVRAAGRLQHDQEDGRGLTATVEAAAGGRPQLRIEQAGDASITKATLDKSNEEMGKLPAHPPAR